VEIIMQVLYSPQCNEKDTLEYQFIGDKIIVTYNGEVDEFDFTDMPDGIARNYGREPEIISTLPISPVIEVSKLNGVLYAQLLKFIGKNASQEDKFPEWQEVNS
jgi:hypothetical protein